MLDVSELVVVGAFSHPHEAHLACSALRAAGLATTIADAHIVAADWLMSNAVGGVKVLVRADDLRQAQEVLTTPAVVETGEEVRFDVEAKDPAAKASPRCGSHRISGVVRGRRIAVATWLLAGVPLFPVWHRDQCRRCGLVFD